MTKKMREYIVENTKDLPPQSYGGSAENTDRPGPQAVEASDERRRTGQTPGCGSCWRPRPLPRNKTTSATIYDPVEEDHLGRQGPLRSEQAAPGVTICRPRAQVRPRPFFLNIMWFARMGPPLTIHCWGEAERGPKLGDLHPQCPLPELRPPATSPRGGTGTFTRGGAARASGGAISLGTYREPPPGTLAGRERLTDGGRNRSRLCVVDGD